MSRYVAYEIRTLHPEPSTRSLDPKPYVLGMFGFGNALEQMGERGKHIFRKWLQDDMRADARLDSRR